MIKSAINSVAKTLSSQSQAMTNLSEQANDSEFFQRQLLRSFELMNRTTLRNGKIVVCGIGKSYKIADKLLATMNSLSIHSSVLHPTDALHGDLGVLKEDDLLIMVTASGNTPELLQLIPHISRLIPIILLTCNKDSKLSNHPQVRSLLYADLPSYLNEENVHGLPAPTVSATLSLALGDAVILAFSELIEQSVLKRKKMFSKRHPGGSIGAELIQYNDSIVMLEKNSSTSQSYSSLLSLNEVSRQIVGSPYLDEETSQDLHPSYDTLMTFQLKSIDPSKVLCVQGEDSNTEITMSEPELLKSIVVYDYILIIGSNYIRASSSEDLKNLYIEEVCRSEGGWKSFITKFNSSFKFVQVDKSKFE